MKVHKIQQTDWLCGDSKAVCLKVGKERSRLWSKVTCKRCLAKKLRRSK